MPPLSLPTMEAGLGELTSVVDMIKSGLSAIDEAKSSNEGKSSIVVAVSAIARLLLLAGKGGGWTLLTNPPSG